MNYTPPTRFQVKLNRHIDALHYMGGVLLGTFIAVMLALSI